MFAEAFVVDTALVLPYLNTKGKVLVCLFAALVLLALGKVLGLLYL